MIKKASFFCHLYLDFNREIDTEEINKLLNIKSKKNKKRFDMSWGIDNGQYKDFFSLEEAAGDFFKNFKNKLTELKEVCNKYKSERPLFIFEIIVYDNCFPELCLDGDNMNVIHVLNADIHFNISNEC